MTEEEDSGESEKDYRQGGAWEMSELKRLGAKRREDAGYIVQHPVREVIEEDGEEIPVETMGLSVSAPTEEGVVTIQNTMGDTRATDRFVALDVDLIDELITGLEEMRSRYRGGGYRCSSCGEEYTLDEFDSDGMGLECPNCGYLL